MAAGAKMAPLAVLIIAEIRAPKNNIFTQKEPECNTKPGNNICVSPRIKSGYKTLAYKASSNGKKAIVKYNAPAANEE